MEDREAFVQRETNNIPAIPENSFWNKIIPKGNRHIHWYLMLCKATGVNCQRIAALPVMA